MTSKTLEQLKQERDEAYAAYVAARNTYYDARAVYHIAAYEGVKEKGNG